MLLELDQSNLFKSRGQILIGWLCLGIGEPIGNPILIWTASLCLSRLPQQMVSLRLFSTLFHQTGNLGRHFQAQHNFNLKKKKTKKWILGLFWGLGFPLTGTGSGSGVLTILLKQPAKFLFLHSLYTPNQTKKKKKKPTVFFLCRDELP